MYIGSGGLTPVTPATLQILGGPQTPTACAPGASEGEQKWLESFKKYRVPTLIGTVTKDMHGFLEKCNHIFCNVVIVEVNEVAFAIFQLRGVVYQWWYTYVKGRPADATPLTWSQIVYIVFRDVVA